MEYMRVYKMLLTEDGTLSADFSESEPSRVWGCSAVNGYIIRDREAMEFIWETSYRLSESRSASVCFKGLEVFGRRFAEPEVGKKWLCEALWKHFGPPKEEAGKT
jgi:hypothetical protein